MLVTGVRAPHRLDVQRSCGVVETSQHATIMSAAPLRRTQAFATPARTDVGFGSKCEKLAASKCFLLFSQHQTFDFHGAMSAIANLTALLCRSTISSGD
jgi:hypothetical protein